MCVCVRVCEWRATPAYNATLASIYTGFQKKKNNKIDKEGTSAVYVPGLTTGQTVTMEVSVRWRRLLSLIQPRLSV